MDYEILFPGRFVKGIDLKGKDVTVTVESVKAEKISGKAKAILAFVGADKEMVMNRTNAEALKLMFGRETDNWLGKQVTISPVRMRDPFGDGEIVALRVTGSPEIDRPMSAVVDRGAKQLKVSVRPTGTKQRAPKQAATAPAPEQPKQNGKPKVPFTDVVGTETEEEALKREAAEYERSLVEADQASNPL